MVLFLVNSVFPLEIPHLIPHELHASRWTFTCLQHLSWHRIFGVSHSVCHLKYNVFYFIYLTFIWHLYTVLDCSLIVAMRNKGWRKSNSSGGVYWLAYSFDFFYIKGKNPMFCVLMWHVFFTWQTCYAVTLHASFVIMWNPGCFQR